jgi:hypothetical protein
MLAYKLFSVSTVVPNFKVGLPCILNYMNNDLHDALCIFRLLSYYTFAYFGRISSPSSGGRIYICGKWYLLYCTVDCQLASLAR